MISSNAEGSPLPNSSPLNFRNYHKIKTAWVLTSSTESGRVRSRTSGRKKAQKAPKIPKKPKIMYGNTGLITANMKITGAMIPPIRATAEQYPIPTFLKVKVTLVILYD